MSDQQILPCTTCGQHHQQMLMLVCMHDPCINCAAIHFCTSQPPNSNEYACPRCGEFTQLDSSSAFELQRVYSQLKGKKKYDYRKGQGSIADNDNKVAANTNKGYKTKHQTQPQQAESQPRNTYPSTHSVQANNQQSYTPISQPSYPTNPYNNIVLRKSNQQLYICQTHPEQQLSYFCFNCNGPICPQCAIHGTHRDHEVQTTRKAIKTIKGNLQKCQDNVTNEIANLGGIVDAYKNRSKDISNQTKKSKDLIKQSLNQLRLILSQKQKQFLKNIDSCNQSNVNTIKSQSQSYDKLIDQHMQVKKNIETTFKKDDLTILQEYNKRQRQANTAIDNSKNKRYNPDLQGLKQIDYQLFRDQIDQLTGIMSALKLSIQTKKRN